MEALPSRRKTMKTRNLLLLLPLVLFLGGCRQTEAAKRKYLEAGDKYAKEGKLREASIMYRSALKRDLRFGEAYLRLADVELRRGEVGAAVQAYRRAFELLPNNVEPASKLGDLYLAAYASSSRHDERWLGEVRDLSQTLLKRDPNSFDGIRLAGFLKAIDGKFKDATEDFRKALRIKPNSPEITYALAQSVTADDHWDEGEKIGKECMLRFKSYSPMYDFMFGQYLKRNRREDADGVLRLKVDQNPKVAYFRMQQAAFFWATQRRPEAEKVFQTLLADKKTFPQGKRDVADFLFRANEFDRAEAMYKELMQEQPQRKNEFKMRLVLLNVGRGKPLEALALAEEVLKDEPQNFDALSSRASLLLQARDPKKTLIAINDLNSLVQRDPKNAVVHFNLGRAYQLQGQREAARVQYAEAVKLRSDFKEARLALAQVLAESDELGKAIAECDEVLKISKDNLAARLLKTNALLLTGGLRQARSELEDTEKLSPMIATLPQVRFLDAGINLAEKHYAEAEKDLLELRRVTPSDLRPVIALATVYAATNRLDQAFAYLEKEAATDPKNAMALETAIANIASSNGRYDRAEKTYMDLLQKEPKNLMNYLRLGEVQRLNNEADASLATLRKGYALDPTNPAVNLQLGMTLEAQHKEQEAKPMYELVLKAYPDNPVALNNLAYMMAEEGRDLDQALKMAQKAKAAAPNNDEISDTLGWIFIKKNLSDSAINIYRDLLKREPNRPEFHYHLGMALFQKGDKANAKVNAQMALNLLTKKPNKQLEDEIREFLKRLG